jgi:hypothetical protein
MLSLAGGQIASRASASKGPRALGLIELAADGKGRLVPIAIMINGRFYDASVYKADPVPMALEQGTVYEAVKSGVSQGLFTVAGALQSENRGWIGAGKWETNAQIEAVKARAKAHREKLAQKAPPPETEIGGPPKLRRGPGSASPPPSQPPAPASAGPPPGSPDGSSDTKAKPQQRPSAPAEIDDPNRPVLRRRSAAENIQQQTKAGGESEPLKGPLQFIPAISDADGPDARPYSYQMKPEEERDFLKKMQAMAADEVRSRASAGLDAKPSRAKTRPALPQFSNVEMHVFDLANNNEPVLVLTASAKLPASDVNYMVAVVARQDIYADLHKAFAAITDNQHLDVTPRYEFIDAVDANGDGVAELLFRLSSDSGVSYSVYRVIGDSLWPVFEGHK